MATLWMLGTVQGRTLAVFGEMSYGLSLETENLASEDGSNAYSSGCYSAQNGASNRARSCTIEGVIQISLDEIEKIVIQRC